MIAMMFVTAVTLLLLSSSLIDASSVNHQRHRPHEFLKAGASLETKVDFSKLNALAGGGDDEKRCWLRSYGRGVGRPLSQCASNLDKGGLLCYPRCSGGYTPLSFVCWQNCPAGFTDFGVGCGKPAPYGRGAGYAAWDKKKCENNNPQGCEWWGAMVYPRCRAGFYPVGCCICSPNCQDGMSDAGVSCTKKSYTRGAGVPMICKDGEQSDAGLCYNQCTGNYKGVGPVCWGSCPAGYKECGALCMEKSECTSYLLEFLQPLADLAIAGVEQDPAGGIGAVADVVTNLIYPICP